MGYSPLMNGAKYDKTLPKEGNRNIIKTPSLDKRNTMKNSD